MGGDNSSGTNIAYDRENRKRKEVAGQKTSASSSSGSRASSSPSLSKKPGAGTSCSGIGCTGSSTGSKRKPHGSSPGSSSSSSYSTSSDDTTSTASGTKTSSNPSKSRRKARRKSNPSSIGKFPSPKPSTKVAQLPSGNGEGSGDTSDESDSSSDEDGCSGGNCDGKDGNHCDGSSSSRGGSSCNLGGTKRSATYYQLLKENRPFRLYLTSYVANSIGEWLTYLASMTAIEDIQRSHGIEPNKTLIAMLILVRLTPNVIMSPFGGVLADRMDRRKCMMVLDLAGAVVSWLFVVAFCMRSISMIYLATFLQECIAGLYEPSRSAIIPLLVPEENELQMATTIAGLAWSAVAAFGSALGGLLVSLFGIRCCYLVDSLTYLVSVYLMGLIGGNWKATCACPDGSEVDSNGSEIKACGDIENGAKNIQQQNDGLSEDGPKSTPIACTIQAMILDGCKYLNGSFFGALVFLKFSASMLDGAVDVLSVSFSERGSDRGRAARLGLLFASTGAGSILGPLVADPFVDMTEPSTLQVSCLGSLAVSSIGLLLTGFNTHFALTCACLLVKAMGSSVLFINSSLLLQKFSAPDMLGRVTSIEYALEIFGEAVSAVLAGILEDDLKLPAESSSRIFGLFGFLLTGVWIWYHCLGGGAASVDEKSSATMSTVGSSSSMSCMSLMEDDEDSDDECSHENLETASLLPPNKAIILYQGMNEYAEHVDA